MDKKALIALFLCGIAMLYFFKQMQPAEEPGENGPVEVAEQTLEQGELKDEIDTGVEVQDRQIEKIDQKTGGTCRRCRQVSRGNPSSGPVSSFSCYCS